MVHRYGSLGHRRPHGAAPRSAWPSSVSASGPAASVGADVQLTSADALPLMSSNAFAIAETGLHAASLHALARAADTVCALSFVAPAGQSRGGQRDRRRRRPRSAARARSSGCCGELLADQPGEPAHLQDFFGLRTWPQVHGPVLDTVLDLKAVVETAANTASENPLFTGDRRRRRR